MSMLYHRLDAAREQTAARLNTARRTGGGTPQARWERDATASLYAERLTQLQAAENWLCFGRLDLHDGETRYIGRVGLFDDTDCDREPLLLDWRAPAARSFYLATALSNEGVRRRRHIRTSLQRVVGVDDEVLDLDSAAARDRGDVTGEAALLAALAAPRSEADARHRPDHSGRPGPDRSGWTHRRAGRAGRSRDRQDRSGPPLGGVPAL